jgi:regulator of protease activity HflC (stomatin/prohibitin superfamily)
MKTEKNITPLSGYLAVLVILITFVLAIYGLSRNNEALGLASLATLLFTAKGLLVISPNSSKVFLLFGEYKGSIKQNGLFWINPFYNRMRSPTLC